LFDKSDGAKVAINLHFDDVSGFKVSWVTFITPDFFQVADNYQPAGTGH